MDHGISVRTTGNLGGEIDAMEIALVQVTGESLSEVLHMVAEQLKDLEAENPLIAFHDLTVQEMDVWVASLYLSVPTGHAHGRATTTSRDTTWSTNFYEQLPKNWRLTVVQDTPYEGDEES